MKGYVVATAVFRSTDPGSNDLGFKDVGKGEGKSLPFCFEKIRNHWIFMAGAVGFDNFYSPHPPSFSYLSALI
jgi:hypothetical protein